MRTATLLPVLLAAALPVAARGESWPALPPEVWTLKEDPAKGIKGALILEERIHFERFGVTYSYRILVLNEAGRSAAEFTAFPSSMRDFKGRTVFPDGRVGVQLDQGLPEEDRQSLHRRDQGRHRG